MENIDNFEEDSDDSIADKNYEPSSSLSSSGEDDNPPKQPEHSLASGNSEDQSTMEDQNTKKCTRKRIRDCDNWEKNKKKIKRNLGEEYVNAAKNKVEKKVLKGPCNEICRLKCFTKFTEDQRKTIFEKYWKLGSIDKQRDFIHKNISEIIPPYRYTKTGSNRSKTIKYTLQVEGQAIRVCKTFFKNTLAINNRTIFTTTKKKDEYGFLKPDQRGKHGKQKRVKQEVIDGIREHFNSFPRVSSHYCRARTKKEYLDGSLNIATMYRLYVENCIQNNQEYAKISMYSKILNTETNIAFHVPKKDQCSLCTNYENGDEDNKEKIKEKFEKHLQEKELSRQEKKKDTEETDENVLVCCFDLQAVLTTPCGEVNSFFYKRRLATYNFTVFDVKQKLGLCFLWHEGLAKRGANEIGSCLYHYLSSEDCKSENIIFYSDNCVGQNKNKFVFALYLFCVLNIDKIKSITHKFLVIGHTQNEGDSVHACIEKEKNRILKSGPIYVPAQWATIIRSAKKKGTPYKVNEISTEDIFDLKALCTQMGKNYVKNTENEKVVWKDVRIVKVEKMQPYIIFYKTSYSQYNFKSIDVRQNSKHLRNNQEQKKTKLLPAYKKAPSIDAKKKENLLELCKENAIKQVYWPFYKGLSEKSDDNNQKEDVDISSCSDSESE